MIKVVTILINPVCAFFISYDLDSMYNKVYIVINDCLTKSILPDNNCTKAIFTPNWIIGHIDTWHKNAIYIDVLLASNVVHHNVLYLLSMII